MLGKKWKLTKVLMVGVVGGFVGKFVYDEYVKDTPLVDVTKARLHRVKEKGDEVAALFVKKELPENTAPGEKTQDELKEDFLRSKEAAVDVDTNEEEGSIG